MPVTKTVSNVCGCVYLTPRAATASLQESLLEAGVPVRELGSANQSSPFRCEDRTPAVLVVDSRDAADLSGETLDCLCSLLAGHDAEGILIEHEAAPPLPPLFTDRDFLWRNTPLRWLRVADSSVLDQLILHALEHVCLKARVSELEEEVQRRSLELEQLNDIGIALSAERDLEVLLEMILEKSREITSADAGSLYLVQTEESSAERHLLFMLSQNDSLNVSYQRFTLALDENSIAGYVALNGTQLNITDVYEIGDNVPYDFNKSFDEKFGYFSKSMLTVPMKNTKGEVLGIIQLINCKRDFFAKLVDELAVDTIVQPFDARCEELVSSLASQAAVALENNLLYKDIENLFEGFVRAAVSAIESRDPPTSGHSERVAILTIALAEETSKVAVGPYRNLTFNPEQMKELRYASLLHDLGKVGVRENVLVKPKKLPERHLELVNQRFEFIHRSIQFTGSRQELDYLLTCSREEYQAANPGLATQVSAALQELDDMLMAIVQANEPNLLPAQVSDLLQVIASHTYEDLKCISHPYLEDWEIKALSIPKGSLDEQERKEIESHVTQSFRILSQIPWTKGLKEVPRIAFTHHEKLDGSGYPRGINTDQIPVQAKMMTISDIYDALTAADRPYKNKVPTPRALDILHDEANKGQLDKELLEIFIDRRIHDLVNDWKKAAPA